MQHKNKQNTDVPQVSRKRLSKKHGNDGTIFPLLDACRWSVGVLNGGETQFEGVRVGSSWKNRTTIKDMKNYLSPACSATTCLSDTYLRFSSGSGSSWREPPWRRWWTPIPADLMRCGHWELHHLVVINTNMVRNYKSCKISKKKKKFFFGFVEFRINQWLHSVHIFYFYRL